MLRGRRHLRALAYLQVILDVALAAAVVALTGLAESIFVFMYSLAIVSGAILLYRRGAVLAVVVALPVHVGMQRWLEPPRTSFPWSLLLVHAGAFAVTAVLASYLAEALRRTGEQLAAREGDLAAIGRPGRGMLGSGICCQQYQRLLKIGNGKQRDIQTAILVCLERKPGEIRGPRRGGVVFRRIGELRDFRGREIQ